jgi:hypothetical protein
MITIVFNHAMQQLIMGFDLPSVKVFEVFFFKGRMAFLSVSYEALKSAIVFSHSAWPWCDGSSMSGKPGRFILPAIG